MLRAANKLLGLGANSVKRCHEKFKGSFLKDHGSTFTKF